MATGSSSAEDDLRVLLLGRKAAGKTSFANRLLSCEDSPTEETRLCVWKQGEYAGKRLTVVDTPGWDRISAQRTSEQTKEEIMKSPTLCLPGPHSLLLILPITIHGDPPSEGEIQSASHHVELLSIRDWRHTIVLFVCQEEVDKSVIDQYVQGAKKLIGKCDGSRDSQVTALLQTTEDMVEGNNELFLTPSVLYGVYEEQQEELKQWCETGMEEVELEFKKKVDGLEQELNDYETGSTRARRGSITWLPPKMEDASQERVAVQHQDSQEMVELQGWVDTIVNHD